MSRQNFSVISFLLIIALIFSALAVIIPPAAVQAVTQSITIVYPASGNITYVKPGGLVTVATNLVDVSDATPRAVNYQVYNASLGNIFNQNLLATNATGYTNSFNVNLTAPQGLYNLTLVPQDNVTYSYTNTGCIYVDSAAPTPVNLTAPNSTTCLLGGGNLTVTWSAYDAANPSENVTIYADLSTNSGSDGYPNPILAGISFGQGTQSANYTVPGGITSSQCKVRLKAKDRAGNESAYQLSSLFSIITSAPTVTGLTPDTGGTWNSGQDLPITATLAGTGTTISYLIELLVNGVNTENITSSWQSVALTGGNYTLNYTWPVSGSTNATTCKIRVLAKDCAGNTGSATSSTNFTIRSTAAPSCTIYTPLQGSTKYAGKSDNITFWLGDNIGGPITCEFWFTSAYTDNCTTCWTGASGAYLGTPSFPLGDNYLTWTVPVASSDTCKIKIICTDSALNTATFLSPTFKVRTDIQPPAITVCTPSSGSFPVGSTASITWTASDQPDATARLQYDIYLSTNNGTSFPTLIASLSNQQQCTICSCPYSWAVSDNVSSTCKIKIRATDPAGNLTDSLPSGSFAITAAANPVQTGSVTLYAGWNLMSLPLIPTNTSIANILAGVMPSVISVQYYQDAATGFIDYTPGAEGNTLLTMEDGKAYWIKMSTGGPYTLTFQGRKCFTGLGPPSPTYPSSSTTFPIGWAMVGFKSTVNQTVQGYLKGTCSTDYSLVSGYDPLLPPDFWFDRGCADNMTPGKGYWVKFLRAYAFEPGCQ